VGWEDDNKRHLVLSPTNPIRAIDLRIPLRKNRLKDSIKNRPKDSIKKELT
ncbi:hypothetical protein LOAG_14007, partial [Loa loa]